MREIDAIRLQVGLSRTLVNVGDLVNITQQIACIGNTGVSTGSHLHYEIRKEGYFLNPAGWCYLLYELKIQTAKHDGIN